LPVDEARSSLAVISARVDGHEQWIIDDGGHRQLMRVGSFTYMEWSLRIATDQGRRRSRLIHWIGSNMDGAGSFMVITYRPTTFRLGLGSVHATIAVNTAITAGRSKA